MRSRHKLLVKLTAVALAGVLGFAGVLPTQASATPHTTAIFQSVQLPCQSAAVHYSAWDSSMVIGLLRDGDPVEVLETGSYWYTVTCDGMTGYVRAQQIVQSDEGYIISCQSDSNETKQLQTVAATDLEATQDAVVLEAMNHLGTPYVWGGTRPGGFDCSGFVYYVYGQIGYSLNRTAMDQLQEGLVVDSDALEPGDLVFFHGTSWENSFVTHIGIYIGDGQFIHASNHGIAVESLSEAYWVQHYSCARRVLVTGVTLHGIASGVSAD